MMKKRILSIYTALALFCSAWIVPSAAIAAEAAMTPSEYDHLYTNLAPEATEIKFEAFDKKGNNIVDTYYPLTYMTDGKLNTAVRTKYAYSFQYATYDFFFKDPITFNKTVLFDGGGNIREYEIQISDDGQNWKSVHSYSGQVPRGNKYAYFEEVTASFIRIRISRVGVYGGMTMYFMPEINEFEIYNVTETETYRLDNILKEADNFLQSQAKSGPPYFPDRISALENVVNEAKEYKKSSAVQNHELENYVTKIREALNYVSADLDYTEEQYETYIYNRKNRLTAALDNNPLPSTIKEANGYAEAAKPLLKSIIRDNTSMLWEDIGSFGNLKPNMHEGVILSKISTMARAYTYRYSPLKGNEELRDAIVYAMDIFQKYWYGNDMDYYEPMIASQIVARVISFSDVAVMMYDEMDYETLARISRSVLSMQERNYMQQSGVNLYEMAVGAARLAAVVRDEDQYLLNLNTIMKNATATYDKTTEKNTLKDGYYVDGSYIFHNDIPYATGYGLYGIIQLLALLKDADGTVWQLPDEELKGYLKSWALDTYIPLMWRGSAMGNNNGRSIDEVNGEKGPARQIQQILSQITELVKEEEFTKKIYGYMKYWNLTDSSANPGTLGSAVDKVIADDSVEVAEPLYLNKAMRFSDRAIHHRGDWAFALAMSSKRIAAYESMSGLNKKGWYTNLGMTYFYDCDDMQYNGKSYFEVVDPYRLPGITVIKTAMEEKDLGHSSDALKQAYAGSVSLNEEYGAAAYKPEQLYANLNANKSYFMFDDEVVMLGSGISADVKKDNVETIVEQRIISDGKSDDIAVNGSAVKGTAIREKEIADVKTAHIQGRTEGSQFGYYFPEKTTVKLDKQIRESNDQKYKGTVAALYIDHGKTPSNASYEYVVLPGKTIEETQEYKQNPDVEILVNELNCHAVRENTLNITGMNVFSNESAKAGSLTINKACAAMLQEGENVIDFALSDPTLEGNGIIDVTIDQSAAKVISCDENITVKSLSPKIELQINTDNTYGKSLKVSFSKKGCFNIDPIRFSDIIGHWAEADIVAMNQQGYVNGVSEESFRPDDGMTRAEVAVVLNKVLENDKVRYQGDFQDVHPSAWYANDVATVHANHVMLGNAGLFYPEQAITREEFAKIIGGLVYTGKPFDITTFQDYSEISDWAEEGISTVAAEGLMIGDDKGSFHPHRSVTRAEAVSVLRRYNNLNK
ncbi:polysaccharide lyase family 8 super-sandwich domain-containing protein [Acetivibrio sp. MSJd-27]|uniref:polysaccharide lyase family 8 super-sandwich domain-containing protein n=1 Tax=Acetivibrio sp. MSJd-27 TaxID=2841523 RepID=UPI001C117549|nr:polysaccharide lyase family 8 super-sandwich domain-containing protein [Acetivibrio sp. MSJd-27]MBU5451001.1 S-layer homology domain-containing protein [Acetivibrio sp. MSJd-27]